MTRQDKEVFEIIAREEIRQKKEVQLIASENYVSDQVRMALIHGAVFTNKYAEGYPGKRYYNGCKNADDIEQLAIDRLKKLFKCEFANVQPHSGSQANTAVFLALLNPGDKFLSMSLAAGGHLSHGVRATLSGKWFQPIHYEVDSVTDEVDYDKIEEIALRERPKLIIAGYSAYSRLLNWKKFRKIADKINALLMVDMAHIAGLIAANVIESPLPFADVITSTTHKTLRGPRGGIILSNNPTLYKKLNSAVFPGIQGGPLMHIIAAKAVCFFEALQPEFTTYIIKVLQNIKIMEKIFHQNSIKMVANGSDNHMLILNFLQENFSGHDVSDTMQQIGMICNKNMVPNDIRSPILTSGIRIGTPAATSIGFVEKEFIEIAQIICTIINNLRNDSQMPVDELKNRVNNLLINDI